ncbi:uncharacterized protein LOC132745777 [Ruditapes philippinarum]|uniref:uncharacterized protein LOC132745777 n=1 Tax=Ruditapes philippinarum TaxID=129788 RepID=UPI00295B4A2A|nr:uncharacterized protein LOC132745777 [Ruditapes philippinarum]
MAVPGKKAITQFSSSTTIIGSDEDFKVYCQPCDRDGPRLPAHGYCTNCSEHLCETCFTGHRRHTLSRLHTLLDKTNMPQTLSPATPRQPDNFTKPCPKHNIEMIKFYCHDHKALLCSVCVTLNHTATSCKVNYIPDISDKTINSTEYQDVLKELNDMAERSSETLQDLKTMIEKSDKSLKDVFTDILKFRTKINQRLDEMERQVKKAAKIIKKDNSNNMKSVKTTCIDVFKSLRSSADVIKHFNASKQANDLFMELKHAKQMIKNYEKFVAKPFEFEVKKYKFEANDAIADLLDTETEKSLGTLKGTICQYRRCLQMDKIRINTPEDGHNCYITGMTLLTPDVLIITDYQNNEIKMVDISRKSVLAQISLDSEPWDVTSVSKNEFAVTLPFSQTIQFFSVSSCLMTKQSLKVCGECFGISCHKDKMVVSYCKPAKVQILFINGTVLQTIQDENIFITPEYITANDNCIYVSDKEMKIVTKLNWQCQVTGKYICTDIPLGLTMSDYESLFVCYRDNNTIEEISGDCSDGQVVLKNIENPQAVYWSAETCTLCTSSHYYNIEDNFIKLFKLSSLNNE